jgi:type IV secretory pathway VirB10-like protein
MDIQFWIWLIIIVLTFVARARKQKPKPQPQQEQESWEEEKPSSRPLTFEELLREIQQAKEPPPPEPQPVRPYRQVVPEPTTYREVDYDDNIGEEERGLETVPAGDESRATEVYERAKQEAFSRPSLEETMKLEDTIVRFGQFKEYETSREKAPMADFLAQLHDPEGLKKAFIMSEILTRRV